LRPARRPRRRPSRAGRAELLATVPADDVNGSQVRPEDVGDLAERDITGGVAVQIIESLEMVQIDHHHRQLVAVPRGSIDLLLELGRTAWRLSTPVRWSIVASVRPR
jgi:hypothetical protein